VAAKVARALGVMDRPAPNKVHRQATPYLGGLAVVGGLMVVAALTAGASGELVTILAGGLTFFVIAADRGDYLVASFSLAVAGAARIGEGRPPHVGGTDHSSHRLAARGVRGRGIALLTYSM